MQHGARPLRSTRRLANLAGTRPGWYKISNSVADAGPTLVSIYDEIGFYGVAAADFLAELRGIKGDIQLNINSPGGDVWDGIAIYNTLRQAQGKVQVIVDGLAASAASFIAQAASPGLLEMAPHSQLMIHDGFGMVIGNAADLRETAELLDRTSDEIAGIYADRTGKPAAHWREQMRAETWYSDAEAVAAGLADKVHGQDAAEPGWDLSVFARFAATVVNADSGQGDGGGGDDGKADCPTCKGSGKIRAGHVTCPDCKGSGKVDKDPDGDGDDDTTKAGDTDHDYAGASPPKKVPGANQIGFPVLNADVDNSAWDASKAWHAGSEADDPAAFYRGICAGRKAGDPSTQGAWALPYKYSPSSPPNAAGVRAALGRLSQTEGLTNEAQARSTLEKAMKLVNPDYEPDDSIDPGLLASVFCLGLEGAGR